MVCPKCGGLSRPVEATYVPEDAVIYRSCKCRSCKHSFYTAELVVEYNSTLREAFRKYPSCKGDYGNRRPPDNKIEVRCIDTGEIFESASAAGRSVNVSRTAICLCCQGKHKTAGGKKWEYFKENKENKE